MLRIGRQDNQTCPGSVVGVGSRCTHLLHEIVQVEGSRRLARRELREGLQPLRDI
jgi:hypothetical protein